VEKEMNIGNFISGKDFVAQRILLLLAVINGYCTFQGLSLVEELNDGGFLARAATTIIATGTSCAIYFYWHSLYLTLPALRSTRTRAITLLLALVIGSPLIILASAHPNATGISGIAALNSAIQVKITEFEQATGARFEATGHLHALLTEISIARDKLDSDRTAENRHGLFSGKGGSGAVRETLSRIIVQLDGMQEALRRKQAENEVLLTAAQADLTAMREAAGRDVPSAQRVKTIRGIADVLRGKLVRMDSRPVTSSMARILTALPGEVLSSSLKFSSDPNLAKSQKEALLRLSMQIGNSTGKLADLSTRLAEAALPDIPEFQDVTPMRAMLEHWRDYTSVWAIAILIDMAPLLPLLFLLCLTRERTRAELAREQIASLTVRELLLSSAAIALLRSNPLDASTIQSLTDEQFGREQKP
jgi:hypothetical protein